MKRRPVAWSTRARRTAVQQAAEWAVAGVLAGVQVRADVQARAGFPDRGEPPVVVQAGMRGPRVPQAKTRAADKPERWVTPRERPVMAEIVSTPQPEPGDG
jgi:hypothetical protein